MLHGKSWQVLPSSTNVYGYLKMNANNLKASSKLIKLVFENSPYRNQRAI